MTSNAPTFDPAESGNLVFVGFHPETLRCVALEVELDDHHRFLTDDPAVVTGFDGHNLRRPVLDDAAVRIFDVDFAVRQKTRMRVHTEIRADDMLHILRPAESRRVDHPLDASRAGASDVEAHVSEIA